MPGYADSPELLAVSPAAAAIHDLPLIGYFRPSVFGHAKFVKEKASSLLSTNYSQLCDWIGRLTARGAPCLHY